MTVTESEVDIALWELGGACKTAAQEGTTYPSADTHCSTPQPLGWLAPANVARVLG